MAASGRNSSSGSSAYFPGISESATAASAGHWFFPRHKRTFSGVKHIMVLSPAAVLARTNLQPRGRVARSLGSTPRGRISRISAHGTAATGRASKPLRSRFPLSLMAGTAAHLPSRASRSVTSPRPGGPRRLTKKQMMSVRPAHKRSTCPPPAPFLMR